MSKSQVNYPVNRKKTWKSSADLLVKTSRNLEELSAFKTSGIKIDCTETLNIVVANRVKAVEKRWCR